MSLLQISSAPQSSEDMAAWAFAHQANHRDISRVIFQQHNQQLLDPPLDPFDQSPTWLLSHQELHAQQNQVLGIQGQNLLAVDWRDEESVLEWIFMNYSEHQQACTILNLG